MLGLTGAYPRQDLNLALLGHDPRSRGLIGPMLFPVVETDEVSGKFAKIAGGWMAEQADTDLIKRASRSGYHRVELSASTGDFSCVEYGVESLIGDDERRKYRNQFDIDKLKAMKCRAMVEADQENDVKDVVFNTTNFPLSGDTGLDTSVTWGTLATATPKADVDTGCNALFEKCGVPRSRIGIALDEELAQTVLNTTDFANRMYLSFREQPGDVDAEALRRYWGLGEVLVARSAQNTANLGLTASYSRIWGTSYAFLYVIPPRGGAPVGDEVQAVGFTFAWREDGGIMATDMYRDDSRRSDVVRVRQWRDPVLGSNEFGFLLKVD